MSQPTLHSVHINRPLTMISVAYVQNLKLYVADKVFPVIPVDNQSDLYWTFNKNDWLRDEAKPRAPATESVGSGYGVATDSYAAIPYAIHKDVPDQIRNNADVALDLDRSAVQFVTNRILLRQEIQWASDFFTTGKWATDVTPANLWSDYALSDPIADVETGKRAILAVTGYMPNVLVLGYDVYIKLINHPDIVDRFKYTNSQSVTKEMLAQVFGLERVEIAQSIYATNNEGETAAYSFVHGKNALLAYVAARPSVMEPSAGYTFAWKGVSGSYGQTVGVKQFRMEHLAATRVEAEVAFANKIVASDLGYFFSGAVA